MGEWLDKNGDSVYGTSASPYKRLSFDGRCTVDGSKLYLNVFTWPSNGLVLAGLRTPVRAAHVVATGKKLKVKKVSANNWSIEKPSALDPISTAIVLELAGKPDVIEPDYAIEALPGGGFELKAVDAKLNGDTIQVEGNRERYIGYWMKAADSVEWKVKLKAAQSFTVNLDCSCQPGSEGSTYGIDIDGSPSGVTGLVPKTASWHDFKTVVLSEPLHVPAGTHVIKIVPKAKPGYAVMNLRKVILTVK